MSAVEKWARPTDETIIKAKVNDYRKYVLRKYLFIGVCFAIVFAVTGIAVTIGSYEISFIETYEIIWGHITGNITDSTKDYIVVQLRLPRIVIGIIAGAGLAVAGAVMQSTLLNPLADPYTTGISSGASLGAVLAITLGFSIGGGNLGIVLNAFVFSLIPMFIIITLSRIRKSSPVTMIMAGIAVMYIFNAITTLLMLWADPNALQEVYQWQVGSVSRVKWDQAPIMGVVVLAGIVINMILSNKINVLATGDDNATAMGINANQMRTILLVVVSLMSAVIVSFTGLIGFVGLVAPHICRMFIGPNNRFLIPASAIFGSAILITADLVGRTIIAPVTLQVGVIMSFIGGFIFLWLLLRKDSKMWS